MITREEVRSLWPFYFYKFMRGVFFLTTITLFIFYSEKGLTYFQASIAIAFSSLMQVVFELITGSVADTFGRKKSVVLSLIIDSVIIFGVAIANSFWQFFVLLGLWGVSTTLASGAHQAWAIDSLIHERKEHLLDAYYGKSRSFFNAGMIVAGVMSAVILSFSTNQTLWFIRSGLTLFLAAFLGIFAKEIFVKKKQVAQEGFKATIKTAKEAISVFKKKKVLRNLSVASFFTFFAMYLAESSAIQDFKLQGGIPLEYWGVILFIATFIGIFTPIYGMKLSKGFAKIKNYLALTFLFLGVLYVMAIASFNPIYVAVLAILYNIIDDFYVPAEEKLYNKHTPSAQRASVHSLKSMIKHSGVLLGIPLAGFIAGIYGGALTIALAGLFVIPAVIIVYKIKE
jgi:MFS family permease